MIAILDIGKTNKKCFVFDEDYRIVFEKTAQLPETTDEDGDPCEDLNLLKKWVLTSVEEILRDPRFLIQAINCTTYGASFVHLDADGNSLTPLYNYLKPFPEDLKKQFFEQYGGEEKIALETASPVLGNLNSGLQLYWLKHRRQAIFEKIKWSLHLPQYVALLASNLTTFQKLSNLPTAIPAMEEVSSRKHGGVTSRPVFEVSPLHASGMTPQKHNALSSEITSIGCHTMLWDFRKNDYHEWVKNEGILEKLAPIAENLTTFQKLSNFGIPKSPNPQIHIGVGLHDSSAALIPYLACFQEPFALISTGTWCISLNPFNDEPLTPDELAQDCLCYLTFESNPVKAARFFGGNEHEQAVKRIAAQHGVSKDFYQKTTLDSSSPVKKAYLDFMRQLVEKQVASTRLALGRMPVRRIFVDGGFSKNEIYMTLLAESFHDMEVFAAEVAQATALGAVMAIHPFWNKKPILKNLISLRKAIRLAAC